MLRNLTRTAAAALALPATVAALLSGAAGQASATAGQAAVAVAAAAGPGFPAQYAAPYLETWNNPSTLADARNGAGLKYVTLAFVISDGGCNATFNGNTPITDAGWTGAINAHRAAGGDVIASFGGASGTELGQACTSVAALQAQYKRVVDALDLTRIDLDIEGGALADTAANDRRNQALAQLQQAQAAAGKRLDVNYTLPVAPTGLLPDSLSLLSNAKSRGLNVNAVNIMTMDYGPAMDMGQAAISAAEGLHTQLGRIWTAKTSEQLWAMEGNTPMIGVNDTQAEVFTTANAQTLTDFARSRGIQLLAFWAVGRDKACATNGTLSSTCSGTPQSAYQFSRTFNTVTGGGTTPPTGRTGRITGYGGKCVDVASAGTANGTAIQLWDCNGTGAQSWTVGTDGTVRALGKCLDVTSAGTADGTPIQLWDCNGTGAQQWQARADRTLVNPASGRCLDATGPSSANGTRLQIWDCYAAANQQWTLPA
ncbi:chitinase [Streptomyces sp. TLI_053]|uniref:chitinase n=1 Tax=Streptomyces sp. TLI_053 TaxID=1855352 RepID=UPI00087CBA16|nr:chitinase [Streptomyces sp. TLI_053]SDT82503.1 chitinase [Streptomyces sp. TLI_053]